MVAGSCNTFVFGSNSWGQTGTQRIDWTIPTPTVIGALIGKGVRQVACGLNYVVAATELGELYSWGAGGNGRLGIGDVRYAVSPTHVQFRKGKNDRPIKIAFVAAGHCHTLAISDYGRAYTWGANSFGQLGTGDLCDRFFPTEVQNVIRQGTSKQEIKKTLGSMLVELTDAESIARHNQSYIVGNERSSTGSRNYPDDKRDTFIYGSCGMNFSMLVDFNGKVFTCGLSTTGSLGHNIDRRHHEEYVLQGLVDDSEVRSWVVSEDGKDSLPSLPSESVPEIPSSTDHILDSELEMDPEAYMPAEDSSYTEDVVILLFTLVDSLKEEVIVRCSSGDFHSGAITREGKLYTWGANNCGQLGLGNLDDSRYPRLVNALCPNNPLLDVVSVSCGSFHTAVIMRAWCEINRQHGKSWACQHYTYSWGACQHGQLGNAEVVLEGHSVRQKRAEYGRRMAQIMREEAWKISHLVDNTSALASNSEKPKETTSYFILKLREKAVRGMEQIAKQVPCVFWPIPVMYSSRSYASSTQQCSAEVEDDNFVLKVKEKFGDPSTASVNFSVPVPSIDSLLNAYSISQNSETLGGSSDPLGKLQKLLSRWRPMDNLLAVSCGGAHTSWIVHKGSNNDIFVAGVGEDGQLGTDVNCREINDDVLPSLDKPDDIKHDKGGFYDLLACVSLPTVAIKHSVALGDRLKVSAQKYFYQLNLSDNAAMQISIARKTFPTLQTISNDDCGIDLVKQAAKRLAALSKRRHSVDTAVHDLSKTYSNHCYISESLNILLQEPLPLDHIRHGRRLWWTTADDLPHLHGLLDKDPVEQLPNTSSFSQCHETEKYRDTIKTGPRRLEHISDRFVQAISCGGFHSVALAAAEWIKDSNASNCLRCDKLFTFRVRKHHCRSCGGVFCHNCCSVKMPLLHLGHIDHVRVCDGCYERLREA